MSSNEPLHAADMFAVIDRALRLKAPACADCHFTLPFAAHAHTPQGPNWTVDFANECCLQCRMALEEIVAHLQRVYRLSDTGRFHALQA